MIHPGHAHLMSYFLKFSLLDFVRWHSRSEVNSVRYTFFIESADILMKNLWWESDKKVSNEEILIANLLLDRSTSHFLLFCLSCNISWLCGTKRSGRWWFKSHWSHFFDFMKRFKYFEIQKFKMPIFGYKTPKDLKFVHSYQRFFTGP